jgi:protein SCO1/2
MSKGQKIVTVALWAVLVIVMIAVVGVGAWDRLRGTRQPAEKPLPVLFDAPAFSLVDQNDQPISDESLRGHPYVASFVFVQCLGPCPLITGKMAQLQKMIPNAGVKLISFDVDPAHDTPAVLKAYAAQFNADSTRWHFLTGKPTDVYAAIKGMKIALEPAVANTPLIHSTRLLLIDAKGQVRGLYNTGEHADADTLSIIARDANQLAQEKFSP